MKTLKEVPSLSSKVKGISDILIRLKKEDGTILLTKDEANNLSNLKFKNGENILTMEYRWFVYEIVWLLVKLGYEPTFNYLTTNWEDIFGITNIRKKMLFENPLMASAREKFLLDMEIFRNKTDLVHSGEKCKRCQSDATVSVVSQTLRCDEIQTIRQYCTSCSFKWRAQ